MMSNEVTCPMGTFVLAWSQIEIDGLAGAPIEALECGATWLWRGDVVRIDGVPGLPTVRGPQTDHDRRRAATGARQLVDRALAAEGVSPAPGADPLDRTFTLTDGSHRWIATLIEVTHGSRPLVLFTGGMPPPDAPLFVIDGLSAPQITAVRDTTSDCVVCFTPGTHIETPDGLRFVEDLVAGDRVITKDGGAQSIHWVGTRHVSGARLYAMPDLRPVRIREGALGSGRPTGDLIVSPDHRVLVRSPVVADLWGEDEVLVAARDLINGWNVARDMAARSATYIHLMLERHGILVANGVETESFHPGDVSLDAIDEDQRLRMLDVVPALAHDQDAYGRSARRVLNSGEAALLGAVA